jgi:hypothetical protein
MHHEKRKGSPREGQAYQKVIRVFWGILTKQDVWAAFVTEGRLASSISGQEKARSVAGIKLVSGLLHILSAIMNGVALFLEYKYVNQDITRFSKQYILAFVLFFRIRSFEALTCLFFLVFFLFLKRGQ